MFRRVSLAMAGGFLFAIVSAGGAFAAQPFVECDEFASSPPGFETGGFATAEFVYAGSEGSHSNADNWHAVSQYDIACQGYSNAR